MESVGKSDNVLHEMRARRLKIMKEDYTIKAEHLDHEYEQMNLKKVNQFRNP